MKTQRIANTPFEVSRIALGCLGLGGSWDYEPLSAQTRAAAMVTVRTALDQGINFFDHASIYACGKSEEAFSAIWRERPGLRHEIVVQSKAGIRLWNDPEGGPQRYDFSYDYLMRSVEGSLKRLGTDYLDILLLHRPDPLVEPEEVARALGELQASGKVRFFGVSNHTPYQIELLKKCVKQPFVVNQLEINVVHNQLINAGVVTNQDEPAWPVRGEGTLEYCRLHDITVQAWSPLARGYLSGRPLESPDARLEQAAALVAEMARGKGVNREAIVLAWLLRHPARIQPIVGTTNPQRLIAACQADGVELTREEWYRLFIAGRGGKMP
jgi:predicted oxidoreductase